MTVKKFLENLAGNFINLHDTLRAIAVVEKVSYQEAALFLHRLINNPASLQPTPKWKTDPMSVRADPSETAVKLCLRCLEQAATHGEPPFCDGDGFHGSFLFEDAFPGREPLVMYQDFGFNKPEINSFLLAEGVDISKVDLKDATQITSMPFFSHEFKGNSSDDSLVKLLSEYQRENSRLSYETQELEELKCKIQALEDTINKLTLELEKKNSELVSEKIKYDAIQQDIADGKSRSTLLKIIAGLALCGRKIDIRHDRLNGVSGLVNDFETVGARVDVKTLRNYLKESSEYLDY